MRGRIHPLLVDAFGAGAQGNIFRQGAEARACPRSAVGHARARPELMRERVLLRHPTAWRCAASARASLHFNG